MARNSGFNRFLEFIGLVEDNQEPEYSQERYPAQQYDESRPAPSRMPRDPAAGARLPRDSRTAARSYPVSRAEEYPRQRVSESERPMRAREDYDRPTPRSAAPEYEMRAYRASEASERYPRGAALPMPSSSRSSAREGNVVSMRASSRHQTVIYYLRSFDDCRDVINDLLDEKTVLLNLEDMDGRTVQRAIDMLSGATFALNATIRKASVNTYLIAPNSVDVAETNDVDPLRAMTGDRSR